jgi:hypothetical protein
MNIYEQKYRKIHKLVAAKSAVRQAETAARKAREKAERLNASFIEEHGRECDSFHRYESGAVTCRIPLSLYVEMFPGVKPIGSHSWNDDAAGKRCGYYSYPQQCVVDLNTSEPQVWVYAQTPTLDFGPLESEMKTAKPVLEIAAA